MYDIQSLQNRRRILRNFSIPPVEFFSRSAEILAPELIGCLLTKRTCGRFVSGIIVETEAYTEDDPASHSFRGRTVRNRSMFKRGGFSYVYLIYGIHNCFNVTSGIRDSGEAVLIRAVKPAEGIDIMITNRSTDRLEDLCSGPGRLAQAFGIDREHDGLSLRGAEIQLLRPDTASKIDICVSTRIGIKKGVDLKRRFAHMKSRWVSV